jgi:hypothetical protein
MELASIDSLQDPNNWPVVTSYAGPLTLYFYRHIHIYVYIYIYIYALFNYVLTNTYAHTHQTHPYPYQAYKKLTYIYTSALTKHTPI